MKLSLSLSLLLAGPAAAFTITGTSPSSSALSAYKVFIDGEVGTTGLQVYGRLEKREDLEIISAPFELRKDEATRKKLINEADVVILCEFFVVVESPLNGHFDDNIVPIFILRSSHF
jgi:hypothetical protein